MDQNINDLMNAAKIKLETQEKQNNQQIEEDIYAEMMQEMDDYTGVSYSGQVQEQQYNIQYEPEAEANYYIDPNDTPIFEGGPGISQIDIWKKQYTKEKIFHTCILDKHFVFRTLNRFEYKQIVAIDNIDALYREEIICNTCVLWPLNYDFKKMASEDSGYPSTLAQIIMENSGFTKEYGIEVL
jgi:hypothetical protein